MKGIALPGMDKLPPGRQRDLVEALHELYRQAGIPGTRTISKESRDRDDLPDTISHEGVSGILRGEGLPRWSKIECLVRILVDHAVGHPDVEASVRRIQELWLSAVVGGSTMVEPAQVRPSSAAHLVETSENSHALELEDDDVPPVDVAIHKRDPTARRRRADMKQTLSSGERRLAQVFDLAETDDAIAVTKIIDVLNALPRVGDVRATKVMERLDIPFDRRLGELGKHQIAALLAEFSDTYAANEPKVDFSVTDVRRLWPKVLQEVKAKRRFTWVLLSQNAEVADLRDGTLTLAVSAAKARDSFVSGGNEAVLREAIVAVMGVDFAIEIVASEEIP
jgi:ribosomal protein S13